jgi:hypothetical protein
MAVSSEERGLKMSMKNRSAPDVARLIRSLYFLAMLLGSISPRKNTAMVVMIVERVTAETPQMRVTCTVTMAAAEMWIMLVQMRMVVMARSKLSDISRARFALIVAAVGVGLEFYPGDRGERRFRHGKVHGAEQ